MLFRVFETEEFGKIFEALDVFEQNWIRKVVGQLKANPVAGKPLGFEWFREKKLGGKRLYYLVYKKACVVLLVSYGGKKEQRKIIGHILDNLKSYGATVSGFNV